MREYTRHCRVAMPCAEVWRYLADYDHLVRLACSSGRAELKRGAHGKPGAKYAAKLEWEGIPSSFPAQLDAAIPGRSLTYSGHSPGVACTLRLDFTPLGPAATQIDAKVVLRMGKATRPLEPFSGALVDRLFERMMRKLHALTAGAVVE